MKLTLVSQWFPPEQAPIGYMIKELAEALASDGHDVTIITGFPNHPSGIVFGGYRKKWVLQEKIGNVRIIRVWLATSGSRTALMRILTFLTFTVTSAWALMTCTKPQLIFAVFQPLSVGITLPVLARLKGAKLILNVQDLHPDVPIELGMIRNPILIRILKTIERIGYTQASGLAVICDSFKEHCADRGAKQEDIEVIPNWIDLDEIKPRDKNNAFRRSLGLNDDHFVVLYAGTVGWISGAGIMIDVAHRLRDSENIRVVFVGEGPLVPELKKRTEELALENVIFSPFQSREVLDQVQAMSDVSIVSLTGGKGRASVPSKVLGYMAAGRPVLASVDPDSETARIIMRADCGWVVEPDNSDKLAELISSIQGDTELELRQRLGENGREFLEKYYARDAVTNKYIEFFKRVIK